MEKNSIRELYRNETKPMLHSSFFVFNNGVEEKEYLLGNSNDEFSRWNFLFGDCYAFAIALALKYPEYSMEAIYSSNSLIHAYCKKELNGDIFFIDARGITNNWSEFLLGFNIFDNFTVETLHIQPNYENYDELVSIIRSIIDQQEEEFSVKKFLNNNRKGTKTNPSNYVEIDPYNNSEER